MDPSDADSWQARNPGFKLGRGELPSAEPSACPGVFAAPTTMRSISARFQYHSESFSESVFKLMFGTRPARPRAGDLLG